MQKEEISGLIKTTIMADPTEEPPFHIKEVKNKEDLKSLIGKLRHYIWWSIIIVRMKYMESYDRLQNIEGQLSEWKYTVKNLFEDLIEEDITREQEEFNMQHFIADFLLRVGSTMKCDSEIFAKMVWPKFENKLEDLFEWITTNMRDIQTNYLQQLKEEDCTTDKFEKYMQKQVEILAAKPIRNTPLETIHAIVFVEIGKLYISTEKQLECLHKSVYNKIDSKTVENGLW